MSRNKLISIVCTLALLVGFFCTPGIVFAENTYVRQLRNYSNTISSASLTYSVTAAQFGYVTESTLSGGMHSPILVTARLTNNGSNDVKIANSYIDLTFTTYSQVSAYDCYTSDLMVQMVKNGNDTPRYNIVASNGYSYGGHIVVPAHSSLYLVFEVDIEASYDTSTASVVSPALDAVLLSINSSDVMTGDYPTTGSIPEQLDELETYVGQLSGYTYANGNALANITSFLIAIKNQIVYTGTFTIDRLVNNGLNGSFGWTSVTDDRDVNVSYYVSGMIPVSTTVSIDGLSQQDLQYNVYKVHVEIDMNFRGSGLLKANNGSTGFSLYKFGSNPLAIDNIEVYSTFHESYMRNSNGNLIYPIGKYQYSSASYVIPSGRQIVKCSYDMYYDTTQSPSFTAPSLVTDLIAGYSLIGSYTGDDFMVYDNVLLNRIYNTLSGDSQLNNSIGSASDQAGTLSDQIHQQEETWYDENSAAMEAVGLSSYRFTNQQASGILGVTTQFEQLWLALGNWTLVYIFVLMASLATFVIRHEPTTRVKQMREMFETDRAVARDWEMRTDPAKFSHRRWVENNRRH